MTMNSDSSFSAGSDSDETRLQVSEWLRIENSPSAAACPSPRYRTASVGWCCRSAVSRPLRMLKLSHSSRLRLGVANSTPSIVAGPGVAIAAFATSDSDASNRCIASSAAATIAAIELCGPRSGVVGNCSETYTISRRSLPTARVDVVPPTSTPM
jgi:hypothetical protein